MFFDQNQKKKKKKKFTGINVFNEKYEGAILENINCHVEECADSDPNTDP